MRSCYFRSNFNQYSETIQRYIEQVFSKKNATLTFLLIMYFQTSRFTFSLR